jgi:lysophospholipase L1-like esterase
MTFSLNKSYVIANTSGNVITLTGVGTFWLLTNPVFTLTGKSGNMITAQNITTNTSATITVSIGSISSELTITDPSTSSTQPLYVAVNIALIGVASASDSYSSSYTPDKAIDGNYATFWSGNTDTVRSTWQVDLGANFLVFETRFYSISNAYDTRIENADVYWSQNSDLSSPIVSENIGGTLLSDSNGDYGIVFSNSGSSVRYIQLKPPLGQYGTIAECQIYAYQPPSLPTTYNFSTNANSTSVGSSLNLTLSLPNNTELTNTISFTFSDNGAGGTFSSNNVQLTPSISSVIVTYTSNNVGTTVISCINNGGLTNPSSISITVFAPLVTLNIVFDGNSLTAGVGGSQPYSINCVQSLINSQYSVISSNFGVSGQTTVQMISDANSQIDGAYDPSKNYNIVVCWEGINDLYFGATITQAYNNLVTYCLGRKAKGYKVVICTLTPRQNTGTPANQETNRLAVNQLILTNWKTFADAVANIGDNIPMGLYASCTNSIYYSSSDLVHFTDVGYNIMAGIASTAIFSAIETITNNLSFNRFDAKIVV